MLPICIYSGFKFHLTFPQKNIFPFQETNRNRKTEYFQQYDTSFYVKLFYQLRKLIEFLVILLITFSYTYFHGISYKILFILFYHSSAIRIECQMYGVNGLWCVADTSWHNRNNNNGLYYCQLNAFNFVMDLWVQLHSDPFLGQTRVCENILYSLYSSKSWLDCTKQIKRFFVDFTLVLVQLSQLTVFIFFRSRCIRFVLHMSVFESVILREYSTHIPRIVILALVNILYITSYDIFQIRW